VKNSQDDLSELEADNLCKAKSLERYLLLTVVVTIAWIVYFLFVVTDRSDAEVAAPAAIWVTTVLPAYMSADQLWTSCERVRAAKEQQQQQQQPEQPEQPKQ
jgi:hypothetical protein